MPCLISAYNQINDIEKRVAVVPEVAAKLDKLGVTFQIEANSGSAAQIPNRLYQSVAEIIENRDQLLANTNILLTIAPPEIDVIKKLPENTCIIGLLKPYEKNEISDFLCERQLTSFAMELIPRISRAQSMDVLSSQAAIAGYKAVLIAANTANYFFPMLTTAAGTIRPARVLVIGAGVAGLQAIATAKRLGAIVSGYDVRPETKEQVESLGASFLEFEISAIGEGGYARQLTSEEQSKQQEWLQSLLAEQDVVITTAAVPGRKAPLIITKTMVEAMRPGSLIVDIAAESGGNCELTKANEELTFNDVIVIGPINLSSQLARHASEMYARNLFNFLNLLVNDGAFNPDWDDPIIAASLFTKDGKYCNEDQ